MNQTLLHVTQYRNFCRHLSCDRDVIAKAFHFPTLFLISIYLHGVTPFRSDGRGRPRSLRSLTYMLVSPALCKGCHCIHEE